MVVVVIILAVMSKMMSSVDGCFVRLFFYGPLFLLFLSLLKRLW